RYLAELPEDLCERAEVFLAQYGQKVEALGHPREVLQYYLPMGYRTTIRLTGDLRALTYLVELRATRVVHATLRARAIHMARALEEVVGPHGLVLHLDTEPDRVDVKRGEHDITLKEN